MNEDEFANLEENIRLFLLANKLFHSPADTTTIWHLPIPEVIKWFESYQTLNKEQNNG